MIAFHLLFEFHPNAASAYWNFRAIVPVIVYDTPESR